MASVTACAAFTGPTPVTTMRKLELVDRRSRNSGPSSSVAIEISRSRDIQLNRHRIPDGIYSSVGHYGSEVCLMSPFEAEVTRRFGLLPNFFCTAKTAPGLIEELWKFAKAAYLDSPLPPLFKERLFVHLSRYCQVRYCIVRHVGFLIGRGHPAGSAAAVPETVEQVVELLERPVPTADEISAAFARLESTWLSELPRPGTEGEADLFDALSVMFVTPSRSRRACEAVRASVGDTTFEMLAAYLAFVRTAHFWTEVHPELAYESDMVALLTEHR